MISVKINSLNFDNYYQIYECKYYKADISDTEMIKEEKQIKSIKGLNINKIGFINASKQNYKIEKFNYIDGEELYNI